MEAGKCRTDLQPDPEAALRTKEEESPQQREKHGLQYDYICQQWVVQ
jgi:hypothetical protein